MPLEMIWMVFHGMYGVKLTLFFCKKQQQKQQQNQSRQKKFSKQFCFESEINICKPHLLRRSKCTQLRGLKIEVLKLTQDSKRAN